MEVEQAVIDFTDHCLPLRFKVRSRGEVKSPFLSV